MRVRTKRTRNFIIVFSLSILAGWFVLPRAIQHAIEPTAFAAAKTFVVNVTGDGHDANPGNGICETSTPGNCSLRAAIEESNANNGKDTINFNIPNFNIPVGVQIISPASALPNITDPVIIDGYSQPGASQNTLANGDNAILLIELNGANTPAGTNGLHLANGSDNSLVQGLVINRFPDSGGVDGIGILLSQTVGNTIQGNFIGTNAAGNADRGNFVGIDVKNNSSLNLFGGTSPATRNLISGNDLAGITFETGSGGDTIVQGNFIGTDVTGTIALGNSNGIGCLGDKVVIGGEAPGSRNIISGNLMDGIDIVGAERILVAGNYIGTDVNGTQAVANKLGGIVIEASFISESSSNIIGGNSVAARNVISGNGNHGIEIKDSIFTAVQGNFIGTNASGTAALPNAQSGVAIEVISHDNVIGGTINGAGNVISANGAGGVVITNGASNNAVQGNFIGTAADGSTALGNHASGVGITAGAANTIGGSSGGANIIAFNSIGVSVLANNPNNPLGNSILGNSIYSNTQLGIDLNGDGVTANDVGDGDDGPNTLQNFPALASAVKNGDAAVVTGTLNSTASTSFRIEFFSNPTCDSSGNGEGHKFLDSINATTDASGNASVATAVLIANLSGPFITTTATDPNGNTSEFSKCTQLTTPLPTLQMGRTTYNVVEDCTAVAVSVSRSGDTSAISSVDYATQSGTASERSDFTTALGTLTFAPGETAKSFDVLINEDSIVEGPEAFTVTLLNPSGATLGSPTKSTIQIIDDTPEPTVNTNDIPDAFVCQHYHDFLNREDDESGLAFWTNTITSCGADAVCIVSKRVNASAAFFLSIEFQETGGYVIRSQRVAFGRKSVDAATRLSYQQFIGDGRQVGMGLVVGQGFWQQGLDENKQAYAQNIVTRGDFIARFPTSLSASDYVNALFASAAVTPTAAEIQAAIDAFGAGGTTGRTAAFRSVADSNSVRQAEFNSSFVLMQYFGYLRRNPTDAPDNNDSGYQFWLTKLNNFNGDFDKAEMVKAFISSSEYRSRFGTP